MGFDVGDGQVLVLYHFFFLVSLHFAGQSGGFFSQVRRVVLIKPSASVQNMLYFLHKSFKCL